MLDLQQIKEQYPQSMQGFEKSILREYLQCKILQAIFESNYASEVSFLGGTALRILHGNSRFSEDIDLDNFGLSWNMFQEMSHMIKRFLELEGLQVEIRNVSQDAFHCYVRFPELLYQQGLTPLRQEKILIQIDSVAQGYTYQPDIMLLNKFDLFTTIRVTPLPLLLAQKIFTAVNRKRPKGRDFYDITFLFGKTKPDFGFLRQKLGVERPVQLRNALRERMKGFDFNALSQDVAPFLISPDQVKRVILFREFWEQVDLE